MSGVWMFLGALAVAYLVPGPDMILLLQTGSLRGRAHALAAAAGLAAARAIHVALAALGLAALLQAAPVVFELVRLCGATYLIWLGIGILRAPSLLPVGSAPPAERRQAPLIAAASRGLFTNLLNPKALLFCSVLLPQFVAPAEGGVGAQFLLLGAILVGLGLAFDLVFACAGSALGHWLARHRPMQMLQRWVFGTLLIGFGARLAVSGRLA